MTAAQQFCERTFFVSLYSLGLFSIRNEIECVRQRDSDRDREWIGGGKRDF